MQSELQPVAISCNESDYHRQFAVSSDVRAPSENTSDAANALGKQIFVQDRELRTIGVLRGSLVENIQRWDARRCIVAPRSGRARPTRLASVERLGSPSWGPHPRRVSLKTPSHPGYDSEPCWPMAVIRECNFMEPEVCPWRILRTSP
jgi:hypothetical protein